MTTILTLRAAVADHIRGWLPDLRECAAHPGRVNLDEVNRWGATTPAVRVAVLGLDRGDAQDDGRTLYPIRMCAYIVTADTRGLGRDDAALAIVETLAARLPGAAWGAAAADLPTDIKADNLYAGDVGRTGIALWAVTWTQRVLLGDDILTGEDLGPVPRAVYVGWAPEIGIPHVDDYERVDVVPPEVLP